MRLLPICTLIALTGSPVFQMDIFLSHTWRYEGLNLGPFECKAYAITLSQAFCYLKFFLVVLCSCSHNSENLPFLNFHGLQILIYFPYDAKHGTDLHSSCSGVYSCLAEVCTGFLLLSSASAGNKVRKNSQKMQLFGFAIQITMDSQDLYFYCCSVHSQNAVICHWEVNHPSFSLPSFSWYHDSKQFHLM